MSLMTVGSLTGSLQFSASRTGKKVQVGNGQETTQSERNSYSTNRGVGKN